MIVAVGMSRFNSQDEPIILILNKSARECIANMAEDAQAICFYNSDDRSKEEIKTLMDHHVPKLEVVQR